MIVGLKILIVLVSLAVALALILRVRSGGRRETSMVFLPAWLPAAILVSFFGIFFMLSMGQVGAGHRGVVLKFGAVTNRTLSEGLYFVIPLVNSVHKMNVQTLAYESTALAASKDLQDVQTTVTLNYSLDPLSVNSVYRTLRDDYIPRIVAPAVQESVKAATAQYEAEKLITERPVVKGAIEENLRGRLSLHGIILEAVSITNFDFSEVFTAAIEAKVSAAQRALEAENKLRQIQVEAIQVQAAAKGEADAQIAKALGEANAILTVATAQAEANVLVNKTLTDALIRYTLVQSIGPDIKVIVLPSGQEFILGESLLKSGE